MVNDLLVPPRLQHDRMPKGNSQAPRNPYGEHRNGSCQSVHATLAQTQLVGPTLHQHDSLVTAGRRKLHVRPPSRHSPIRLLPRRVDALTGLGCLDRRHHELPPKIRISEDSLDVDALMSHCFPPSALVQQLPTRPPAWQGGYSLCGCARRHTQRSNALGRFSGHKRLGEPGRSVRAANCQ